MRIANAANPASAQNVDDGDPVFCYLCSIDEPRYSVSIGQNDYYSDLSDYETVLCECQDTDGNVFWMAMDYGDYKKYFESSSLEGKKIIGIAEEADDIADRNNAIGDVLVFEFESIK